jgi:hypothetical protein
MFIVKKMIILPWDKFMVACLLYKLSNYLIIALRKLFLDETQAVNYEKNLYPLLFR